MRRAALLLLLAGCAANAPRVTDDPVLAMRLASAELSAGDEHDAAVIEVQHLLVSFRGVPRMPDSVTRSSEEAESLAAVLHAAAVDGADFDALVEQHTDDAYPGVYTMSLDGSEGHRRAGMVPAFGDVGWRLEVGEVGVAVYDRETSPFGWHLILRRR